MPELDQSVVYEQPLSERIRAFLRLEHLFARTEYLMATPDRWSSRGATEALIDIISVLSRSDLKKELIKELERHAATLEGLSRNPAVVPTRLQDVLAELRGVLSSLRTGDPVPGPDLRDNELLGTVRQRSSIPAGTCDFDLPSFHFWLQQSAERRSRDLSAWLDGLGGLRAANSLCLRLIRESAVATRETAVAGFFQRSLETATPCQMIRVSVGADSECYPEISGGKHRFTVRFMRMQDPAARPVQTDRDVPFRLLCCML